MNISVTEQTSFYNIRLNLPILVIDDDQAMRDMLETVLLDEGYSVILARNGKDAPLGERLYGTLAAVTASVLQGAHIVRVHDVRAAVEAVQVADEPAGKLGRRVNRRPDAVLRECPQHIRAIDVLSQGLSQPRRASRRSRESSASPRDRSPLP